MTSNQILFIGNDDIDILLLKEYVIFNEHPLEFKILESNSKALKLFKKQKKTLNPILPKLIIISSTCLENDMELITTLINKDILNQTILVVLTNFEIPKDSTTDLTEHSTFFFQKPLKLNQFIGVLELIKKICAMKLQMT